MPTINFQETASRVDSLNAEKDRMTPERLFADQRIKHQLWDVIDELNDALKLGLENTCLDIRHKEGQIVISYGTCEPWEVNGSYTVDGKVTIDQNLTVAHTRKPLSFASEK